jgi:antitoxin (DNA-binding transcriptional repressor) of toxin-antitoxin stability system
MVNIHGAILIEGLRAGRNGYDRDMAVLRITEAELVNNIADVMRQVRQGCEIIVEQGNQPVAVIRPSRPVGRPISEVIADLKAWGSTVAIDDDFARDIEEGIRAYRQPWNPPSWD